MQRQSWTQAPGVAGQRVRVGYVAGGAAAGLLMLTAGGTGSVTVQLETVDGASNYQPLAPLLTLAAGEQVTIALGAGLPVPLNLILDASPGAAATIGWYLEMWD